MFVILSWKRHVLLVTPSAYITILPQRRCFVWVPRSLSTPLYITLK